MGGRGRDEREGKGGEGASQALEACWLIRKATLDVVCCVLFPSGTGGGGRPASPEGRAVSGQWD